jgi:hypothetical protein
MEAWNTPWECDWSWPSDLAIRPAVSNKDEEELTFLDRDFLLDFFAEICSSLAGFTSTPVWAFSWSRRDRERLVVNPRFPLELLTCCFAAACAFVDNDPRENFPLVKPVSGSGGI